MGERTDNVHGGELASSSRFNHQLQIQPPVIEEFVGQKTHGVDRRRSGIRAVGMLGLLLLILSKEQSYECSRTAEGQ